MTQCCIKESQIEEGGSFDNFWLCERSSAVYLSPTILNYNGLPRCLRLFKEQMSWLILLLNSSSVAIIACYGSVTITCINFNINVNDKDVLFYNHSFFMRHRYTLGGSIYSFFYQAERLYNMQCTVSFLQLNLHWISNVWTNIFNNVCMLFEHTCTMSWVQVLFICLLHLVIWSV